MKRIIQTTKEWKEGHHSGLLSAIAFLKQWDNQLAPVLEGRKMSSIVLCKFNLTKRRHPEMVKDLNQKFLKSQVKQYFDKFLSVMESAHVELTRQQFRDLEGRIKREIAFHRKPSTKRNRVLRTWRAQ